METIALGGFRQRCDFRSVWGKNSFEQSERASSGPVMQADGAIDVVVAFRRVEKELDAAGGLLPLIAHNRLHDVPFRSLIASEDRRGAVSTLQSFPGAIQKLFVSDKIPFGMFVLQLNFDQRLIGAKIKDGSL